MGSIMDQERPWERDKKPPQTMRERIKDRAIFGHGAMIDQIITELERLEKGLK